MASRTLTYKVWDEQVFGKDPDARERGITRPEDWRNPDIVVNLDGARIETKDEAFRAHQGGVEPDWGKGWYAWKDNGGQTQILFESSGEKHPPSWVRTAKLEGRVIYGSIILRDEQFHS
jgi:hypothetical protein